MMITQHCFSLTSRFTKKSSNLTFSIFLGGIELIATRGLTSSDSLENFLSEYLVISEAVCRIALATLGRFRVPKSMGPGDTRPHKLYLSRHKTLFV